MCYGTVCAKSIIRSAAHATLARGLYRALSHAWLKQIGLIRPTT